HNPTNKKKTKKKTLHPNCQQPFQILKSFIAINYFYHHDHGLISKKRVEFVIA
ncbi:zinc ribbon domain-containing protein, partial [Escherichia coli]|nr:zinc ribbon domain-containing protein [Escherichia coli]